MFNLPICIRRMPRICPKTSSGVNQPLSGYFMTCSCEANQFHNALALLGYRYTLVEVCLIKYRDREIQSLIKCRRRNRKHRAMRVMLNIVGQQKMWSLEPFWTGKMSIRAYDNRQLTSCSNFERLFLSYHFLGEKMNRSSEVKISDVCNICTQQFRGTHLNSCALFLTLVNTIIY